MRPVLIFARAPRLGEVKRRLAAGIGAAAALAFYRRALFELVDRLRADPTLEARLVVTPDDAVHDRSLWPDGVPVAPQGEGDVGARMRQALEAWSPGPVVLVGSDVPGIRSGHLHRAFGLLERHDLVFGPSPDGGFWLVGTRRRPLPEGFFREVRWSSPAALRDSLEGIPPGWRVGLADELADVDDARSYRRWLDAEGAGR